eukprot:UN13257
MQLKTQCTAHFLFVSYNSSKFQQVKSNKSKICDHAVVASPVREEQPH